MDITFSAASTAGLNNPGTEIITLVKDGSGNFINPPSYDKIRAYLRSGEVPMLFVTDEGGETGSLYQLVEYSETENKIRFSTDANAIEFCAGCETPDVVVVQPDWNQNDSTAADYVKNRPFYTGDPVETVLVEGSAVSFADGGRGMYYAEFSSTFSATVGETYAVSWDGTDYECVCSVLNSVPVLGNLSILGAGNDTGEPFVMLVSNGKGIQIYTLDTSASHAFSISSFIAQNVQIPDKYISNTFRDVIIAGDPLKWPADDWTKYYGLFQGGKLLKINSHASSKFEGYVLSMLYGGESLSQISVITPSGNFYTLSSNITTNEIYWKPIFQLDMLYLTYQRTGSDPSSYNQEKYNRLEIIDKQLAFTTKVPAEDPVQRKVMLEGDKELILSSSTTDSTKKFKITVDDSGNISATELT